MASTIPEKIQHIASPGDRKFFHTLKDVLPDDYTIYYKAEIGDRLFDFLIIGPHLGILVLSTTGITNKSLLSVGDDQWHYLDASGQKKIMENPMTQARSQMDEIVSLLSKDNNLLHLEGKYRFQLKIPYGCGVVFTKMNEHDFMAAGLYSLMDPYLCFMSEELDKDEAGFSIDKFTDKLFDMITVSFRLSKPLKKEEIGAISYHLFPELKEYVQGNDSPDETLFLSPHTIKNPLSKQKKSRKKESVPFDICEYTKNLSKNYPHWNILILAFNRKTAQNLQQQMNIILNEPEDLFDFDFTTQNIESPKNHQNIKVRHFHSWMKSELKANEAIVFSSKEILLQFKKNFPEYDAIFIKESQLFKAEQIEFIKMLAGITQV
ncbi:NERD domain-containing protein [Bacillus sp. MUM 13]|uniref:NERD domain-containing protein n=1 Tax=Bacillus sp. MUM 13 TaxID=1678001 RepID=UPI0008F5CFEE|nr:NERD domain-containing protein [Bacillus sp. MUM 13]OIK14906.1 hypothetical protein BIV59_01630 [Bacillus sp. MUM 13]